MDNDWMHKLDLNGTTPWDWMIKAEQRKRELAVAQIECSKWVRRSGMERGQLEIGMGLLSRARETAPAFLKEEIDAFFNRVRENDKTLYD